MALSGPTLTLAPPRFSGFMSSIGQLHNKKMLCGMNDYLPFYLNPYLYIYSTYYWISLIPASNSFVWALLSTVFIWLCQVFCLFILLEAMARVFKISSGFKGCSVWFCFHFNSNQQLSAVSQVRMWGMKVWTERNCVLNGQSRKCSCATPFCEQE